jgi:hypothetical protein
VVVDCSSGQSGACSARFQENGGQESRDAVPRYVADAMAIVGRKTEEVYRRYAIVDDVMVREAAIKMRHAANVRRTGAQRAAQSDRPAADR